VDARSAVPAAVQGLVESVREEQHLAKWNGFKSGGIPSDLTDSVDFAVATIPSIQSKKLKGESATPIVVAPGSPSVELSR
jgi:hypothetical protein